MAKQEIKAKKNNMKRTNTKVNKVAIENKKNDSATIEVENKKHLYENDRNTTNKKTFPWWLLGLICPVIGIILFLLWRKDKTILAKNILTGTIIGTVVWIFVILSFLTNTKADPKPVTEEVKFDAVTWYNDTLEEEPVVTVIGSSTCPHCQDYHPVITALSEEYGFKLYFVEADKISEEDYTVLATSYQLESNEGYVPYTFIIKDAKVIAETTGYESEQTTIEFLKQYEIIK